MEKEELIALINEQVKGAIEPLLQPIRDRQLFPGSGEGKEPKDKHEELKQYFWNLQYNRAALSSKALAEGTDAAGGYLVPDEFKAEIIRIANSAGVVRRNARIIPMTRKTQNWPRQTAGVAVYWVDENTESQKSEPTYGQVILNAKKLVGRTPMSEELLEDSAVDLFGFLATIFAETFSAEEDRVAFQGNTASGDPFTGILNDSNVTTVTMAATKTSFSDLTFANLSDMIDALVAKALPGAKFYMHRNILNYIRKIQDTQGDYIWSPPTANEPSAIWGYPYELVDNMPSSSDSAAGKAFMTFGNLKNFFLGDRKLITAKVAEQTETAWAYDQPEVKFVERVAMAVAEPTGLVNLKTAAS